jgi:hypothetical protein
MGHRMLFVHALLTSHWLLKARWFHQFLVANLVFCWRYSQLRTQVLIEDGFDLGLQVESNLSTVFYKDYLSVRVHPLWHALPYCEVGQQRKSNIGTRMISFCLVLSS